MNYFPKAGPLPSPSGALSARVPSLAIAAANREVQALIAEKENRSKKRGPYTVFTARERAKIGKYAAEHGVAAARRWYLAQEGIKLNESTIRGFKRRYLQELSKKPDVPISALYLKKRGRPVLLGEKMDVMVQEYVEKLWQNGGVISTDIVKSGARGILQSLDRTSLSEYGGHVTLSTAWAKSLLRRMHYVKRRGTTKAAMPVQQFQKIKTAFLQEIIDVVTMEEVPSDLIFNWDQTGLNLVPASSWTMDLKGSKRVEIKGLNDKRQITGVFCASLTVEFLPIQLVYGGETDRCHPNYQFPLDWDITHSDNHWSNELTMLPYIEMVIVPYVTRVRRELEKEEQAALAIFDCFKGQVTQRITDALEDHNIHSVIVPAGCTDRLQPLDLSVNKSAKAFLRSQFQDWYSAQVTEQLSTGSEELEPVELPAAKMKCIGGQWLVRLVEYLSDNPRIVVNGFLAAGIPQSLDKGKPVIDEDLEDDNETQYETSEDESDPASSDLEREDDDED